MKGVTFSYGLSDREKSAGWEACTQEGRHMWDEQWVYGYQDCLRCGAVKVYRSASPEDFFISPPKLRAD